MRVVQGGRGARLVLGCAGLALLSACAGGNQVAQNGYSLAYYRTHAAGNYAPPGPPSDPWGPYINIAANRFDVPPTWIRQVMRVESGGHEYLDGQLIVSAAGAMGLMQLEPATYQEMASRYGLGQDPFNPYDNIMAGTAYIHEMYQIYGSPGFLAAYNAGPGRLDSYMNYHTPLPGETINYVAMIAPNIQGYYPVHRSEADQLALNTQPMSEAPGLLPPGFNPDAPARQMQQNPLAPVQVASIAPPPAPVSSVYTPAPVRVASIAPPAAPMSSVYTPAPVRAASIAPPAPIPEPPPPPAPHPSFSIIPAAVADTTRPAPQLPVRARPVPDYAPASHHTSGWAIQVGAYDTSSNARAALGLAELSAVQMLINGHPVVMSVVSAGHVKYRARVVGLPRDDAVNACSRLSTGPTGCMVLPPEAQS
ncbi:transglycosylase SLT domain-containing protein [Acidocella sp.]|uniref:transglycosylase SLT domain-containing protein n=1 Tax=Acidocella sp. TaxID=50710 RepID=UPI0026191A97|nr:transglycosylase SLT domain-containing protein [Acidocella sp.]